MVGSNAGYLFLVTSIQRRRPIVEYEKHILCREYVRNNEFNYFLVAQIIELI
jgi:hypothetical protein